MLFSVVAPCYNEAGNVARFYALVLAALRPVLDAERAEVEFVLVDDGSRDETAARLAELAAADERVRALFFSRNFGKEAAVLAGLEHARGDYVFLLDADLQHPVELMPQMWERVKAGADVAFARRRRRVGEGRVRAALSRAFYRFNRALSGVDVAQGTTDYRLMTREVVRAFLRVGEYHRFCKNIFEWLGFTRVAVEFDYAPPREAGASSWSLARLVRYACDGVFSFSVAPLRVCLVAGAFFALLGGAYGAWLAVRWLAVGHAISGWTTLASLMCFFGGLILIGQGISGEYIARIYEQVKLRPHYVLRRGGGGGSCGGVGGGVGRGEKSNLDNEKTPNSNLENARNSNLENAQNSNLKIKNPATPAPNSNLDNEITEILTPNSNLENTQNSNLENVANLNLENAQNSNLENSQNSNLEIKNPATPTPNSNLTNLADPAAKPQVKPLAKSHKTNNQTPAKMNKTGNQTPAKTRNKTS